MAAAEIAQPAQLVPSLDERRDRILSIVGNAAIEVGEELHQAKREHPREFMAWVATELPFGIDKAERMMAVSRSFATAGPELVAYLPKPWTTLFELSRLPIEQVQQSIETGDIHPTMTRDDARKLVTGETEPPEVEHRREKPGPLPGHNPVPSLTPDIIVGELLRLDRSLLDDKLAELLFEWLED